MLLRGSWYDKVVNLSGYYDKNVWLLGTSDAFALRIKAALLGRLALSGAAIVNTPKCAQLQNNAMALCGNRAKAQSDKHIEASDEMVLTTAGRLSSSRVVRGAEFIPINGNAASTLCLFASGDNGMTFAASDVTALQVRLRRLGDLADMTFADVSSWTLHDFYYMEV